MDRRSWLWRRKSSEKSPGETESSGSISSPSERFSDEQAYSNHGTQSPEITSKATDNDIEHKDTVKTLKEKLSAALLNISAKEELVKQHAKVAEEAVSGWEKAETEVLALKQQLEAVVQKNSALEDRVGHLDGALKECLRQLRQAREVQDQKIQETVSKKTLEWETTKSDLESQLLDLQLQLQDAKAEAVPSTNPYLGPKLEEAEKENSSLRLELISKTKELELMTMERDLSTHAAETASKQHLDSIKKVAKLDAECRRLKVVARKATAINDQRSITSSFYLESFTDSQSDNGDRLSVVEADLHKISGLEQNECMQNHSDSWAFTLKAKLEPLKNEKDVGKDLVAPSVEIDLMDDFLEMERIASLPETGGENLCDSRALSDQPTCGEIALKVKLEAMIRRTVELEEKLEKFELEKQEAKVALTVCQDQLNQSKGLLDVAEIKLAELQMQLTMANEWTENTEVELHASKEKHKTSIKELKVRETKLVELQTQLTKENEARRVAEREFEAVSLKLKKARDRIQDFEVKLVELHSQFAMETEAREAAEMELDTANAAKEVAESRLLVVESELKAKLSRIVSLEEQLLKERAFSEETAAKFQKFEDAISRMKCGNSLQKTAKLNGGLNIKQDKELAVAASKFSECQKTIASLGRQLKYLSVLDNFLLDSEKNPDEKHKPENGGESLKLHSSDLYFLQENSETNTIDCDENGFGKP